MICHSYAPTSFVKSSIIPIPKGARANLTGSDKYRSIAISGLLSKLLDYVIINQQNLSLKTSDYQFDFKLESSTILCTTMVKETSIFFRLFPAQHYCLLKFNFGLEIFLQAL